jgi:hypothetical protein
MPPIERKEDRTVSMRAGIGSLRQECSYSQPVHARCLPIR